MFFNINIGNSFFNFESFTMIEGKSYNSHISKKRCVTANILKHKNKNLYNVLIIVDDSEALIYSDNEKILNAISFTDEKEALEFANAQASLYAFKLLRESNAFESGKDLIDSLHEYFEERGDNAQDAVNVLKFNNKTIEIYFTEDFNNQDINIIALDALLHLCGYVSFRYYRNSILFELVDGFMSSNRLESDDKDIIWNNFKKGIEYATEE